MSAPQLDLLDAAPGPAETDWRPLDLGNGRAYRWRLVGVPECGPEVWERPAGVWVPRRCFELQYRHEECGWRDVRFWGRKIEAWAAVRTLPGMPGADR